MCCSASRVLMKALLCTVLIRGFPQQVLTLRIMIRFLECETLTDPFVEKVTFHVQQMRGQCKKRHIFNEDYFTKGKLCTPENLRVNAIISLVCCKI